MSYGPHANTVEFLAGRIDTLKAEITTRDRALNKLKVRHASVGKLVRILRNQVADLTLQVEQARRTASNMAGARVELKQEQDAMVKLGGKHALLKADYNLLKEQYEAAKHEISRLKAEPIYGVSEEDDRQILLGLVDAAKTIIRDNVPGYTTWLSMAEAATTKPTQCSKCEGKGTQVEGTAVFNCTKCGGHGTL